ncbi:aspartate/glutamate racemase family protein [Roseobacter sinensis]|uniref:Aspartate/glutamate racemase family protein n=1 Tax=Roseobacter sinensis TaxID=2931391 RepID=A0ABT3BE60_9RHOB|nr:aspartate/glutamate racemase family protein [Roseobacter sp. WL0113]MCV3271866.1 aspartate/glutamate racemase family protein [Roseobacter sp. WL0113]
MAVVIINPNSTASMTEAMVRTARHAAPGREFEGWTSEEGPASIQGEADGAAATPPLLRLVRKAAERGADGIIIGCFDDTGLAEAAKIAGCPVVGIGQAAYHFAALRQWRFSVVTTLPVSVPIIEHNIRGFGLGGHLSRVRASNVAVLDLERRADASEQMILEEARAAEREDDIDAVVLGCAGMVNVTGTLAQSLGIKVIDPVAVAASSMLWLV